MTRTPRAFRNQCFWLFQSYAEDWFEDLAAKDPRHFERAGRYSFHVARYGRWGGVDKRELDVLYGTAPFDNVREFKSFEKPISSKLLVQDGGNLNYHRSDDGFVSCWIRGPASDERKPAEDAIIVARRLHPARLLSEVRCLRHMRYYQAMFEYWDVDGDATWKDRLIVNWLRFSRPYLLDNVVHPSRAWRTLLRMLELAITVGMSGSLWWLLTYWLSN